MRLLAPNPDDAELAAICHALGNPLRLAIMRYIAHHPGCICNDLVLRLDRAQATISQHLAILRRARVLIAEQEGAATCYRIDQQALRRLEDLARQLSALPAEHEQHRQHQA